MSTCHQDVEMACVWPPCPASPSSQLRRRLWLESLLCPPAIPRPASDISLLLRSQRRVLCGFLWSLDSPPTRSCLLAQLVTSFPQPEPQTASLTQPQRDSHHPRRCFICLSAMPLSSVSSGTIVFKGLLALSGSSALNGSSLRALSAASRPPLKPTPGRESCQGPAWISVVREAATMSARETLASTLKSCCASGICFLCSSNSKKKKKGLNGQPRREGKTLL